MDQRYKGFSGAGRVLRAEAAALAAVALGVAFCAGRVADGDADPVVHVRLGRWSATPEGKVRGERPGVDGSRISLARDLGWMEPTGAPLVMFEVLNPEEPEVIAGGLLTGMALEAHDPARREMVFDGARLPQDTPLTATLVAGYADLWAAPTVQAHGFYAGPSLGLGGYLVRTRLDAHGTRPGYLRQDAGLVTIGAVAGWRPSRHLHAWGRLRGMGWDTDWGEEHGGSYGERDFRGVLVGEAGCTLAIGRAEAFAAWESLRIRSRYRHERQVRQTNLVLEGWTFGVGWRF